MMLSMWETLCELAPWLLLGMALSGLMHVLLPVGLVKQRFQGGWGVVRSVLWGIPLPLCSCGVIPTGIGLKNQGASNGSAVGFLISTPQTGVDSILVSGSFLGWPFAFYKVFVALVTGLVGGWIADQVPAKPEKPVEKEVDAATDLGSGRKTVGDSIRLGWQHALEIVESIWGWLIVGVVVSAVITDWVPQQWIASLSGLGSLGSMLAVLLFSLPLYVCATASVPVAAALVASGMPPSSALVFLIAGPATNLATIGAIGSRFGKSVLAVYLGSIVLGSLLFGMVFDQFWALSATASVTSEHLHTQWWQVSSAWLLIVLLVYFAWKDGRNRLRKWRRSMLPNTGPVLTINITGLHCGGCVSKLETALLRNPDIRQAKVDLASETASIVGDLPRSQIETIIRDCGFAPVSRSSQG